MKVLLFMLKQLLIHCHIICLICHIIFIIYNDEGFHVGMSGHKVPLSLF